MLSVLGHKIEMESITSVQHVPCSALSFSPNNKKCSLHMSKTHHPYHVLTELQLFTKAASDMRESGTTNTFQDRSPLERALANASMLH